jgi:hypothetical protein
VVASIPGEGVIFNDCMKKSTLVVLVLIVLAGSVFWWMGGLRGERKEGLAPRVQPEVQRQIAEPESSSITRVEDAAPPRIATSVTPGAIVTSEGQAPIAKAEAKGPTAVDGATGAVGATPAPVPVMPPAQMPPSLVPPNELDAARTEAEAVALNIRQYRLRFGGNPVGTNADIVKELDGGNPKTARYLPSELKRLNEQGELIDAWGTPYFFHQLSAEEMETRSAGPDRELWTSDDVVSK